MRLGLGDRPYFRQALQTGLAPVDFVELVAEHYFDACHIPIAEDYPVVVHSLAMSLGSPDELDEGYLACVKKVADLADAQWVSDHLAFTRTAGIDLGHLNPVPLDEATLELVSGKVRQVQHRLGRPFLVENIATHLSVPGGLSEPLFLNRLCEATGCGILLDVTNLFVNAANHGFDVQAYLRALNLDHVRQIHLIGYSERQGRLHDEHGCSIQDSLLTLLQQVLLSATCPIPVLIEWDQNFPNGETLRANLLRVDEVIDESYRRTCRAAV